MREGTSGLLLTENKDGSIRIEVVDYGISEFDGGDLEMWYEIDRQNAEKLHAKLSELHSGTFEEKLIAQFGAEFHIPEFEKFCNENDIKCKFNTWTSY